ncbi:HEPN domain-containing protein [Candidatus Poribacteria bacterium]|nr:HEPN domain-containing protein [Candidatus Poribacteria bacterium]
MPLQKAKELLNAAEMCLNDGFYNACALCCYASFFWAAIAALEREGFRQAEWSHGGLTPAKKFIAFYAFLSHNV